MGLLERIGWGRKDAKIAHLEDKVLRLQRSMASGVPHYAGKYQYETNMALTGSKKWETLRDMERDPHVKSTLRGTKHVLVNAEWGVEPASDKPRSIEIAEFCEVNLLRRNSDRFGPEYWSSSSWRAQRLPEILRKKAHGFSMFHKTRKRVGSKVVFDKLKWLEPSSVDPFGWVLDDEDNLLRVLRTYQDGAGRFYVREAIAADDLALYVEEMVGAEFEGTPFVRCMYGAWLRKVAMQRQSVIWGSRVGSPLPVIHYPATMTPDQQVTIEEFARGLNGEAPEEGYLVVPMGPEGEKVVVEWTGADVGEVDRMGKLIDGENSEIAHGGATKSQQLGETETGSRALGDSLQPMEMAAHQAEAEEIAEWETHGVGNLQGLIEELVSLNFSGVKEYPRMVVSKIDPHEVVARIEATAKAKKEGLIPMVPEIRRRITEDLGYKGLPDEAFEIEEPPPIQPGLAPTQPPVAPPAEPDKKSTEEESAAASLSESAESFKARIADLLAPAEEATRQGGTFRAPTRLEAKLVNLAAVQESFRVGERDVLAVLRRVAAEMVSELMGRLRSGKITLDNIESQGRSNFRGRTRAKADLVRVFDGIGRAGVQHVVEEIKRAR